MSTAFWHTWFYDMSFETLPDISMFSKGRILDVADSRIAYDQVTGKPFLLSFGVKHWISDQNVINRCGFAMGKAVKENLDSFEMGKLITLDANKQLYQCQLVVQTGSGTVFFVHENELHGIPNPATFNSVFTQASWGKIKYVDVLSLPRGNLFHAASLIGTGTVYLVYGGTKYPIESRAAFDGCGFDWGKVKSDAASLALLKTLKQGPMIL